MKRKFNRLRAMLMLPLVVLLNFPLTVIGADLPEFSIKINHDPVEEATAGERIFLDVEVEDDSGVGVVRAYFKAAEAVEYNFVVFAAVGGSAYTATLPAPANGVGSIEYLILVKNGNNQVIKTQTYSAAIEDDDEAADAVVNYEKINVYSELEQVPSEIAGFSDNIVIDAVESAAKLGVVAGIYGMNTAGISTSGAVAVGTVTAGSGVPTTVVVVSSVVAAAAVGGVAVSSSNGSSNGHVGGGDNCPYFGNWAGSYSSLDCLGYTWNGNWTGTVDTTCYFSAIAEDGSGFLNGSINPTSGAANFSGYDEDCGPIGGPATFIGNSMSGTFSGSDTTGSFSGSRQ